MKVKGRKMELNTGEKYLPFKRYIVCFSNVYCVRVRGILCASARYIVCKRKVYCVRAHTIYLPEGCLDLRPSSPHNLLINRLFIRISSWVLLAPNTPYSTFSLAKTSIYLCGISFSSRSTTGPSPYGLLSLGGFAYLCPCYGKN